MRHLFHHAGARKVEKEHLAVPASREQGVIALFRGEAVHITELPAAVFQFGH